MTASHEKYLKKVKPIYLVINPEKDQKAIAALEKLTSIHGSQAQAIKKALIAYSAIEFSGITKEKEKRECIDFRVAEHFIILYVDTITKIEKDEFNYIIHVGDDLCHVSICDYNANQVKRLTGYK